MLHSFGLNFFFCEFGSRISGQFEELGDVIYQSAWYSYPLDVQRLLPTILIAAQDPFIVSVFGNISCTREAFINVSLIRRMEIIRNRKSRRKRRQEVRTAITSFCVQSAIANICGFASHAPYDLFVSLLLWMLTVSMLPIGLFTV